MKVYDVCNDLSLSLCNEKRKEPCKWFKKEVFVKDQMIQIELGYSIKHNELIYVRSKNQLCLDGCKF